jgi:hypothetical protein
MAQAIQPGGEVMAKRTLTITDRKLSEGLYQYKVLEFTEETDAKKGHDLFKVKMATVSLDDGKTRLAWDRFPLTEELEWKLISFLVSTGHVKDSGEIDWDDADMIGREGFFEVKHTVEVGGTRTFANFRYLHPEDERIVDMDAPVVEPKQNLLSKLQSSKNGAASNGEEGTATGYSRVGHDHTEKTPN